MPDKPIKISDNLLIRHLKTRVHDTNFMRRSVQLRNTLTHLHKDIPLLKQTEVCYELWEVLFKEAMLYLRRSDKREFFCADDTIGEDTLIEYFKEWVHFEDLLYASYKFYRDHTIHTLRIYLLGDFCLTKTSFGGFDNLVSSVTSPAGEEDDIFKRIPKGIKEAMWCVIALSHDLGEPISRINEINAKIRRMVKNFGELGVQDFTFGFPPLSRAIPSRLLEIISSRITRKPSEDGSQYYAHKQPKFEIKFVKSFESYNHGLMSALLLYRTLLYFLETDFVNETTGSGMKDKDAENFVIRREMLRAVACHDITELYHVRTNQLAMLLILFDELQEWDRPVPKNLFTNIQRSEVILRKFSAERIFFTIKFDDVKEAENYFKFKAQRFISFLHYGTAPNQDRRILIRFDFEVIKSDRKGIFIHRSPRKKDFLAYFGKKSIIRTPKFQKKLRKLQRSFPKPTIK